MFVVSFTICSSSDMLPSVPLVLAVALITHVPTSAGPSRPLQAATASPAAAATTASSYSATDLDALHPLVGQTVEITGTPTTTGKSKSGTVMYLNFAGAHKAVALVFFLKGAEAGGADPGTKKAASEDDLKPFVGKPVSVKGKLADYKGDLQIVIDSLDQIKVTAP